MKFHMMVMTFVLALAACGGGNKGGGTTPPGGGAGGGGDVAAPATGGDNACAQEIALTCGEGLVDGCTKGLTTIHVCVAAAETAGPPCTQEVAKECPDGQVDACLRTPAAAETHVCVAK